MCHSLEPRLGPDIKEGWVARDVMSIWLIAVSVTQWEYIISTGSKVNPISHHQVIEYNKMLRNIASVSFLLTVLID